MVGPKGLAPPKSELLLRELRLLISAGYDTGRYSVVN